MSALFFTSHLFSCFARQVFEFLSGYVLWERQQRLVEAMAGAARDGQSEAQQMIMGDGKTTVVGPMLALMLGEAPQRGGGLGGLVTLVCPKALIAQSKSVLRSCFSVPMCPKPVFTLKFERGYDCRVSTLKALRSVAPEACFFRALQVAAQGRPAASLARHLALALALAHVLLPTPVIAERSWRRRIRRWVLW